MRKFPKFQKGLIVLVLSGLMYYFSSGFGAIWILMWLAPIPILIYAYSESLVKTAVLAFLVGLAPALNAIIGYWSTDIPAIVISKAGLISSCEWTVVTIIASYFVSRIKHPLSLLAYPVLLSLGEWLESLGPQGSFNTIAYSQLHALPAMQIASITGFVGVSFILSLFASSIAYMIVFRKTQSKAGLALGLSLLTVAMSTGYGFYRMHEYNDTPANHVLVGLASYNLTLDTIAKPNLAITQLNEDIPLIQKLSGAGAKIVLLPEDSLTVSPTNSAAIRAQLSLLAKQYQITLIIGVYELFPNNIRYNSAWVFTPEGDFLGKYSKRHFVPVLDDGISPGTGLLFFNVDNSKAGIAICRDLDYPYPAHAYGQADTDILFAPAWDFGVDAEVHAAGAFTRGIENGYTMVRAARNGYLSVTSPTGQIIAEKLAIGPGGATLLTDAPIWQGSSFYAAHGNWFVLVLVFLLLIFIGFAIRTKWRRDRDSNPSDVYTSH